MRSKFIVAAVSILILAMGIDLFSALSSKENTIAKLKVHINETFETTLNQIQSQEFQQAILQNNASISTLGLIENYIDEFEKKQININISQNNKEIFWSASKGFNDICRDTFWNDLQIKICLNLFDTNGEIYKELASSFANFHMIKISNRKTNYALELNEGRIYLDIDNTIRSPILIYAILMLYLLAFAFLLLYLKERLLLAFVFLFALRLILVLIPLEEHFAPISLFSDRYGFNLSESIFGFLVNTFILFYLSTKLSKIINKVQNWHVKDYRVAAFLKVWLAIILVILFIFNIKSLIYHSNLNFNFEDLSKLNSLEQTCLFALAVNGLSLFIFNQSIFNAINKNINALKKRLPIYFTALVFSSILPLVLNLEIPIFYILSLNSILILLFDLFYDIKSKNISWVIWWMIVFSIFLASTLFVYDMRKDLNNRLAYLNSSYHMVDFTDHQFYKAEFQKIIQEGLLEEILNKPIGVKYNTSDIEEYLKYNSNNLETSSIDITAFDRNGNPIVIDFYENEEQFVLDHKNDIHINTLWSFDPLENRYWVSTSFIDSISDKQFYFGFKKNQENTFKDQYPISYFRGGLLIQDQNNLNSELKSEISRTKKDQEILFKGSEAFAIQQFNNGDILVSKKEFASIIKPVALFSLIFSIFGLVLFFTSLLNGYWDFLPETIPLKFWNFNSFSVQIQLVIIMLIIISFMGIAYVTVRFINNFIDNNDNQIIEAKITSMSKNMSYSIRDELRFESALQVLSGTKREFESIHQANIEIYNDQGENVEKFNQKKIDYIPYYYFNKLKAQYPFTIKKKKKDPKSYFIVSNTNQDKAIIGFHSNAEIKANQLSLFDFLGSIVNVYVFLFLIAGAISIAVARSISKPLSVLGEKMQQLKLGTKNEKLEWKSDDEIGVLIENYNHMVSQLEDSAEVLARTERDMAWREMAKQVAHEIKNPLTPMKLSIQYLEKAMKSNPQDIKPMIKRISETLLLQINNLSEIADSFSNFAKLPQANNEKISLNEVVETIHDLFRKREDIEIKLVEPIDNIEVYADKNNLIRVLNNLVKNAIEAIPEDRNGYISIILSKDDKNAVIQVADNGAGIPQHLHKKVFTPNFTTKNSGSGLGLAISSNMLETFNATIHFETIEGQGTDFFIKIPLLRSSKINESESRVRLD